MNWRSWFSFLRRLRIRFGTGLLSTVVEAVESYIFEIYPFHMSFGTSFFDGISCLQNQKMAKMDGGGRRSEALCPLLIVAILITCVQILCFWLGLALFFFGPRSVLFWA